MKSPFPGMDPYLERRWGDVHTGLCVGISAWLQPKLPRALRARIQATEPLDADAEPVSVGGREVDGADRLDETRSISQAITPVKDRRVWAAKRRRWIEILDSADDYRLVTAIEILSPGSKASGKLNLSYRKKVGESIDAGANVVEVDLLRSSRVRLPVPERDIPYDRQAAYYTSIRRATEPSTWVVYPMPLPDRLPTIPIPCRHKDDDVPLELQPIVDQIYLDGGHDDLKYDELPDAPFSRTDLQWIAFLLDNHHESRGKKMT